MAGEYKVIVQESENLILGGDKKISIALMATFVVLTAQYFLLVALNIMGTSTGALLQIFSKVLVGLIFVYAFPTVWKRKKSLFLGTYFVTTLIFLFHYLVFPDNRTYMHEHIFSLYFMCLPAFVYVQGIFSWDVLKDIMYKASIFVFLLGLALTFLIFSGKSSLGTYSMSLSYYMLLPALVFTNDFLGKLSIKSGLVATMAIVVILALGSRGAMLCLAVFFLLKLRPKGKPTLKNVFLYMVILLLGFLLLLFWKEILQSLALFLQRFGIKSRSISLFLRPQVHLSGRDRLYNIVLGEVLKNPILGLGLAGDWRLIGGYVHNFYIEIIAHYGFIFGGFISIVFSLLIFKRLMIRI